MVHRDPLPAFTTPLVGRGAELVALRDLLTSGAFRLLTLTEPPGVGKTRLAVEAARLVASRFPRVVFVDLGVVRDPGLVVASVAQATGIGERGRPADAGVGDPQTAPATLARGLG